MSAAIELDRIASQVADLRIIWMESAAKGKHAEAVSVENEIAALERAAARYEIQQDAERAEKARARAVDAASATLAEVEQHKAARGDFQMVLSEAEAAANALDAALARIEPLWHRCLATLPQHSPFKDAEQEKAYQEALDVERYPNFPALRLQLRIPALLELLRKREGTLQSVITVADSRF